MPLYSRHYTVIKCIREYKAGCVVSIKEAKGGVGERFELTWCRVKYPVSCVGAII